MTDRRKHVTVVQAGLTTTSTGTTIVRLCVPIVPVILAFFLNRLRLDVGASTKQRKGKKQVILRHAQQSSEPESRAELVA